MLHRSEHQFQIARRHGKVSQGRVGRPGGGVRADFGEQTVHRRAVTNRFVQAMKQAVSGDVGVLPGRPGHASAFGQALPLIPDDGKSTQTGWGVENVHGGFDIDTACPRAKETLVHVQEDGEFLVEKAQLLENLPHEKAGAG